MSQDNLKTLKQLAIEVNEDDPNALENALNDYLADCQNFLATKEYQQLIVSLQDKAYKKEFLNKLCYTSMILIFTAKQSMDPLSEQEGGIPFDYKTYIAEFLDDSKTDDLSIYHAKMYYMSNLTSDEVNLNVESFDIPREPNNPDYIAFKESLEKAAKKYETLRSELINNYLTLANEYNVKGKLH